MRTVLSLGLLLLAVVLGLNLEAGAYEGLLFRAPERRSVSAGTTVRIFSAGAGLPQEKHGRRRMAQAVVVGGHLFTFDGAVSGLRVAHFFADGGEARFTNFDLASSGEDARAFAELVRGAPEDTFLAMGAYRTVQPVDEEEGAGAAERKELLSEVFRELGAERDPTDYRRPSWAFLCVRRPSGWIPLAESFSETTGVSLSERVSAETERYEHLSPRRLVDREVRHTLIWSWPNGVTRIDPFTLVKRGVSYYEIGKVRRSAFRAEPPHGTAARKQGLVENRAVAWPYVRLGTAPRLEVLLGLESNARGRVKGVEFQVVVDGEVAASRVVGVDPDEPDAWIPFTVDLSRWEQRWVRLELVTRPAGLPPGQPASGPIPALWGDPVLRHYGFDDEAEGPLRDRVITRMDRNGDGFLLPAELTRALLLYDTDKNGALTPEESPKSAPWLVERMDENGDGKADAKELETWYTRMDQEAKW